MPYNRLGVQRAVLSEATIGDNSIVSAVTNKKIIVISAIFHAQIATVSPNMKFTDGAGGAEILSQIDMAADDIIILPENSWGWFETSDGNALILVLAGTTFTMKGIVNYVIKE